MIKLKGGGYDGCTLRRTIGPEIHQLQPGHRIKIIGSDRRTDLGSVYEVHADGTAHRYFGSAQFPIHMAEVDL